MEYSRLNPLTQHFLRAPRSYHRRKQVDKGLAGITRQRMMDCGVGSDVISLSLPPLHVTPFFVYNKVEEEQVQGDKKLDDWKTFFECPHWLNVCFVDYDEGANGEAGDSGKKPSVPENSEINDLGEEWEDDRDFLEIWAAVRPSRSRGGIPPTLFAIVGGPGAVGVDGFDENNNFRRGWGAPRSGGSSGGMARLSSGGMSSGRSR